MVMPKREATAYKYCKSRNTNRTVPRCPRHSRILFTGVNAVLACFLKTTRAPDVHNSKIILEITVV